MNNRTVTLLLGILFAVFTASAQDVITVGSGSAPAGGVASIPVSVLDRSGTPLGSDAGTGNRIQGISFKVMYSAALVQSVSFTRGGVLTSLTPVFESQLPGNGFFVYIVSFQESTNPVPFTLNASAPGDLIGTLNVTLQPSAIAGSSSGLTLDVASALLSNQAGTTSESVALGTLALVNGSVSCSASAGAPSNLVATASGTSQVNLTWTAVAGTDHYEVWRSFNGSSYGFLSNAPAASYSDFAVAASTTYLYIVRAVDGASHASAFSNVDAATTIVFTDDPLVAMTTLIKAVHITQLRTAVNAFRASAGLGPLASDPTIGVGQPIRAQHIIDLRAGLDQARSVIGLPAISYTDPSLVAGTTPVRAVHLQQLRDGVK